MSGAPRLVLAAALAAAACHHRAAAIADAPTADSSVRCFPGQPTALLPGGGCVATLGPRTLGTATLDTSLDSPICELDDKSPQCLISGTSITIPAGAVVTVIRGRPLLLVAWDAIEIAGTIDVGSHRAPVEVIGAGADDGRCFGAAGAGDAVGGSGGAGGSMLASGGAGGAVGSTPATQATAGLTLADVHGGCRGGAGGTYRGAGGGLLGHSGGALYVMARTSISVGAGARLLAGGEGGGKAGGGGGGGGGGSGGLVVLDAPAIQLAIGAQILAEGGGGGGGGDAGGDAQDGGDAAGSASAPGGTAIAPAGDGGAGSLAGGGGAGVAGATSSVGGGGGGGGASGYVRISGAATGSATISPPPS